MPAEGETRLNSPGFPEYYGNHMECEWVVSIAEGLRIRIHFERVSLPSDLPFSTADVTVHFTTS